MGGACLAYRTYRITHGDFQSLPGIWVPCRPLLSKHSNSGLNSITPDKQLLTLLTILWKTTKVAFRYCRTDVYGAVGNIHLRIPFWKCRFLGMPPP